MLLENGPAGSQVLTINAGSSSIKFALFKWDRSLLRTDGGSIEGVTNQADAAGKLMNWVNERTERKSLAAVGHRIVHGGPKYWEPTLITQNVIAELRRLSPFDPEHLPEEIRLTEFFQKKFPDLPQVACFDTAFHHEMPQVAKLLPIPRRYLAQGVRRYGFHGLSYTYLMQELGRVVGPQAAKGRIILAHLGSGASMAAVFEGRSIDTTMSFTPASGLMMSTRSGDLDPGLVSFLAESQKMSASRFGQMVNHESGLLGVSETSSDMKELLAQENMDIRAREAVSLFCYQAKKWIGAYAAVLGGLDTLVFSGGMGENSPAVRTRICEELRFLGIELNGVLNAENAALISTDIGRVKVRVIRTDEEQVIANSVFRVLAESLNKTRN